MNRDRYKALQLLADHLRTPSKDLSLDAIFNDVKESKLYKEVIEILPDAELLEIKKNSKKND